MRSYGVVYGLSCCCVDCDEQEIRYVGQTINLTQRMTAHKNATKTRPLGKWVHKHGTKHLRVTELETRVEESELDTRERYWIEELGTFIGLGGKGLNVTKGGQSRELDMDELEARKKYRMDNPHKRTLTWEAVQDIRKSYATTAEPVKSIAERHGVVEGTAYSIIMNHNWYDKDYVYARRSKKGVVNTGENAPQAKLTWEKVRVLRDRYLRGDEQSDIAEDLGVAIGTVNRIARNRAWIDKNYLPPAPKSVSKVSNARNCRLTMDEAEEIRRKYASGGVTQVELSDEHQVSLSVIAGIVRGKTYRAEKPAPIVVEGLDQ